MANTIVRTCSELTGGTSDDYLDGIDGAILANGDMTIVKKSGLIYFYNANIGSGVAESSPYIISPDTNAGNTRHELQGVCAYVTGYERIPLWADTGLTVGAVINGTTPPTSAATYTSTNGKCIGRNFNGTTAEDVLVPWFVPQDLYAPDGIKFRMILLVTNATGPAAEGVVFGLSGYGIAHGGTLTGTFGTEVTSTKTAMTESQYDILFTDLSDVVTVTSLAAGGMAMLKLRRIPTDAADTYAQEIAGVQLLIQYTKLLKKV